MNYLAHLYLSGNSNDLKLGNFIGDYVKGNKLDLFNKEIRKGIIMHRRIDSFTDTHPLFQNSKYYFQPVYHRFSGIVVDMVYDHFLAKNWDDYSNHKLHDYAKKVHRLLLSNYFLLPGPVRQFLPFLIHNRRLESYASVDGLQKVLEIMSRYTSLPDHSKIARKILDDQYENIETYFREFMKLAIKLVREEFNVEIEINYCQFTTEIQVPG